MAIARCVKDGQLALLTRPPTHPLTTPARQEKKLPPIYRGKWATASQAEVDEMMAKGVPHCYRFRVPKSQVVTIQVSGRAGGKEAQVWGGEWRDSCITVCTERRFRPATGHWVGPMSSATVHLPPPKNTPYPAVQQPPSTHPHPPSQDVIRGEVSWNTDTLGDFVLLRSNGLPVYNFCVAIDDALMRISHVIRAEEHLPNTLRQVGQTGWQAVAGDGLLRVPHAEVDGVGWSKVN